VRHGWRWVATAILATGSLVTPTTAGAAGGTVLGTFRLHASGQTELINLAAGVYEISVSGVYNYDNHPPEGVHLADAECSEDHRNSQAPLDLIAHDRLGIGYGSLYPTPLSGWQPFRYTLWLDDPFAPPFWTDNPLDDTLDVYIDGLPQTWVPLKPTPLDAGPGVDAGCDSSGTHTYVVPLVSFGGIHTFRIFDTNASDNADVNGGLEVTITQLL